MSGETLEALGDQKPFGTASVVSPEGGENGWCPIQHGNGIKETLGSVTFLEINGEDPPGPYGLVFLG